MGAFSDFNSQRPYKIWPGIAARAFHGERITMALVDLEPNHPVPEHHHENEQMGFVVRGEMEMKIGEESRRLAAGQAYTIPSNTPHSVITTGPEGCVVMDIFAPVRSDWESVERAEPSPGGWPPG
jgi:quercetin dioxygenase-like cupin family protein